MKFDAINETSLLVAALVASAVWIWRAMTLGMRIGELTNEVKALRREVNYIRTRFNEHIDHQLRKEG